MVGLNRHPSELDLTLDQLAEVASVVDMRERAEGKYKEMLLKLIAGRPTL